MVSALLGGLCAAGEDAGAACVAAGGKAVPAPLKKLPRQPLSQPCAPAAPPGGGGHNMAWASQRRHVLCGRWARLSGRAAAAGFRSLQPFPQHKLMYDRAPLLKTNTGPRPLVRRVGAPCMCLSMAGSGWAARPCSLPPP